MQGRIRAIDWLRGLSVIFMIECHSLIFLDPRFQVSTLWNCIVSLNGLVCVSFLFSSGFAGGLVGSRSAKDPAARRRRAGRTLFRLAQVLAMSAYFHVIWQPTRTKPATWLQVDILLCIAIGMATVWGAVTLCRGRNKIAFAMLLGASLAVLALTPWAWRYRGGEVMTELLNATTGSMFPLFPWLAFPLLGAAMGVIAADAVLGRRRLFYSLGLVVLLSAVVCVAPIGSRLRNNSATEAGVFWAGNSLERMWKLCLVLFGLLVADSFSLRLAGSIWLRLFTPIERTLAFFSRHALMAYLAHLSLIYGFLNYQFTKQWHQVSMPGQYCWRTLLVLAGTAVICQSLHIATLFVEGTVRRLLASPVAGEFPLRAPLT
ncbi:hypothetical protein BH10PLA1_BH10PLA1_02050 [soil metagenome]